MKKTTIELVPYSSDQAEIWDGTVRRSRNGTFLFCRAYMEYHAERFQDCSFLVYKRGKAEGVIPGNKVESCFFSHQGLTYGGLASTKELKTVDVLAVFRLLQEQLKRAGCRTVVYKPVPSIYHRMPAEEELYGLFVNNATVVARLLSSAVTADRKIPFTESRKRGIRKALLSGVEVCHSTDFASFWPVLEESLHRAHGVKPVHSLGEIQKLHRLFPQEICLHVARIKNDIVAGVVIYRTPRVAHGQYVGASEKGKACGAIDLIFETLLNEIYQEVPYFEFGTSNHQGGRVLNESLIFQKEGFGGRGVVYDTYQFEIK